MGRVADERQSRSDEASGDLEAKRKGFDARGKADRPEFRREAIFKLARQILKVERQQRLGAARRSFQTMLDWRPGSGRRANGPAGRKCCSARPS